MEDKKETFAALLRRACRGDALSAKTRELLLEVFADARFHALISDTDWLERVYVRRAYLASKKQKEE